jgi:hypothetical protein
MEDNMVKRELAWLLLLLALLFSLPGFIAAAWGQDVPLRETTDEHSPRQCSLASLKGTYGDLEQGTVIVDLGPPFPAPPFPLAVSAIVTYDGKGNVSAKVTASFNGLTMSGTGTGTYTVYPDCTYSDEITPYPTGPVGHHAGTITGEGQQVDYIYTDPWLVASGTLKRIVLWGCSLSTLKGTYAVLGQGTYTGVPIPGLPPPPFPAADVGIFTADGAGHFSGGGVENLGGVAAPSTSTATYTVNRDCTFSDTITSPTGVVIHETGTITGWGDSQEVHSIMTDPGWVFAHTSKKR